MLWYISKNMSVVASNFELNLCLSFSSLVLIAVVKLLSLYFEASANIYASDQMSLIKILYKTYVNLMLVFLAYLRARNKWLPEKSSHRSNQIIFKSSLLAGVFLNGFFITWWKCFFHLEESNMLSNRTFCHMGFPCL